MKKQAYIEKNKQYMEKFDFDNQLDVKAFDWFVENDMDLKSAGIYEITQEIEIKAFEGDLRMGDEIEFSGYLSTFDGTDRGNDTVLTGAFKECLRKQKSFPFLKNHCSTTGCQIGSFKAKEDEKGLKITGKIMVDENSIHEVRLLQKKHINTTSMGGAFGYKRNKDGLMERDKKGRWVIEKVALFEGSLVPVPMNPDATINTRTFEAIEEKAEEVVNTKPEQVSLRDRYIALTKALKG